MAPPRKCLSKKRLSEAVVGEGFAFNASSKLSSCIFSHARKNACLFICLRERNPENPKSDRLSRGCIPQPKQREGWYADRKKCIAFTHYLEIPDGYHI